MKRAAMIFTTMVGCGGPTVRERAATPSPPPAMPSAPAASTAVAASPNDDRLKEVFGAALPPAIAYRPEPALRCFLPMTEVPELGKRTRPHERDLFTTGRRGPRTHFEVQDDLIAEARVGDTHLFSFASAGRTFGLSGADQGLACNHPADVRGIHPQDMTADTALFDQYDATYDCASSLGTALGLRSVRARAIWPSLFYVFSTDRKSVTVIGPPANWVAAGVSPHDQLLPDVGSLTYVTLPIEHGAAKSAAFQLTGRELLDFPPSAEVVRAHVGASETYSNDVAARVVVDVESDGVTATITKLADGEDLAALIQAAAKSENGDGHPRCNRIDP